MDGHTSVRYLQNYIRAKDYHPELVKDYFLKLSEEAGELARAIKKDLRRQEGASIVGTIDEEIWDVIYYALALANCYDIDMESVIAEKEAVNSLKYPSNTVFQANR